MLRLLMFFCGFFLAVFLAVQISQACETGFACSIYDIEQQELQRQEQFSQNIDVYFDKKVNEKLFLGGLDSQSQYNDLFIFKSVV